MTSDKAPVTIKKYANRRLYNTGTSAYVTLEDLATMVKSGEDFVVYDAKNGEDITRSVLTQIIFEQEGKGGQSLLPITFLRQLIRFYGDSMQMLVPSYLEFSINKLVSEQGGFRDQVSAAFGNNAFSSATRPIFSQIEEQTRQNMTIFRQALSTMFSPFGALANPNACDRAPQTSASPVPDSEPEPQVAEPSSPSRSREDYDDMKRQIEDLQRRLEGLAPKS